MADDNSPRRKLWEHGEKNISPEGAQETRFPKPFSVASPRLRTFNTQTHASRRGLLSGAAPRLIAAFQKLIYTRPSTDSGEEIENIAKVSHNRRETRSAEK